MPRQLQSNKARLGRVTGVAPIDKGGTGGATPAEAAQGLGGISRSRLGKPLGPVQADENGRFPLSLLTASGLSVGYTLEGPLTLVNGQTSVFYLTNWSSDATVAVGANVGTAEVIGDEVHVTAPATGSSLTLTIGDRQVVLPIVPYGSQTPVITSPAPGSEASLTVSFATKPFNSAPDLFSGWTDVTASGQTSVSIPSNAIGIEISGRRGTAGAAYMSLSNQVYQLGVSSTRRRVELSGQATLSLWRNGTGELKYRWILPRAAHTASDWEVAVDSAFTTVVASSYNDTVNKTSWSPNLPEGDYFVRTRFYGTLNV